MLHAAVIAFAVLAVPVFLGILWALDRQADRKREQAREDAETAERMQLAA